jgi:CRISPR/Cas system-associated exonuclease Cas4 (RecB family)
MINDINRNCDCANVCIIANIVFLQVLTPAPKPSLFISAELRGMRWSNPPAYPKSLLPKVVSSGITSFKAKDENNTS